jgi:hypothetical protein
LTYLEIINQVLRNLREDTVTSSTGTAYTQLIGFFVKQAYIECANAYQWPQLDETQDVAISASDTSFTITGDSGEGVHDIHSIYNVTEDYFLKRSNYKTVQDKLSDDTDTNRPLEFAYGGETADGTTTIHFYPISSGSYTLRTSYNRKPDLNNTFSDSTFIKLPEMPIILKAWARAVSERGEDGGAISNEIEMQAQAALSDAIALHESNNNSGNTTWYVS